MPQKLFWFQPASLLLENSSRTVKKRPLAAIANLYTDFTRGFLFLFCEMVKMLYMLCKVTVDFTVFFVCFLVCICICFLFVFLVYVVHEGTILISKVLLNRVFVEKQFTTIDLMKRDLSNLHKSLSEPNQFYKTGRIYSL